MSQQLADSVAIVTGSSRGIGLKVAGSLLAEGASVVINGRDRDVVEAAVASLDSPRAAGVVGSASSPEVVDALIAKAQEFGEIDVLINCAGTAEPWGSSILDIEYDAWHQLIDAHLNSTFATCRGVAPLMAARGRGAIVNTSSHAFTGVFGGTGYAAGKGGVNSLTYALAAELKGRGIRVNAVCPGAETRLSTGADYENQIKDLHDRGLLDDLTFAGAAAPAPAEYVAQLYAFLASDLASGITGGVFSGSGLYLGRFAGPAEELVAWDDHNARGPYSLAEIAEKLAAEVAR